MTMTIESADSVDVRRGTFRCIRAAKMKGERVREKERGEEATI